MSIAFTQGLKYDGKDPDFERQQYSTLADMKAVKKSKMPEKYIGYCLEDRKWYEYDKVNTSDDTLGLWREWKGGSGAQVTEMPTPVEALQSKLLQYVGPTTTDYSYGWFYTCVPTGTEDVPVVTLSQLETVINSSTEKVLLEVEAGSEIEVSSYSFDGNTYFIYDSGIYYGTVAEGKIVLASSTLLSTDEEVAALGITHPVVTGWEWSNQAVSPSGGEPASIPSSEIEALFS